MKSIGVVVIGRNEGERLKVCMRSLSSAVSQIVYVDSGSTDQSVEFVESQGFDVVNLDMSIPFSAARARNEGYQFLLQKYTGIEFIQFVDGDCEIVDGWVQNAYDYLLNNPKLAAVCGRRKERYPDKTIYNALCDVEWNTPVGEAAATGGDFMCRAEAIVSVDGFNPRVIAGEEPEMGFRMRQKGWKIERIDQDMTLHDAAMTKFSQWWRRTERSGHAYAQGYAMHGHSEEKYYRRDVARIIVWALLIPLFCFASILFLGVLGYLLFSIYPVKVLQLYSKNLSHLQVNVAFWYAYFLVLGKFPQFQGLITFYIKRAFGSQLRIIEYK